MFSKIYCKLFVVLNVTAFVVVNLCFSLTCLLARVKQPVLQEKLLHTVKALR